MSKIVYDMESITDASCKGVIEDILRLNKSTEIDEAQKKAMVTDWLTKLGKTKANKVINFLKGKKWTKG